MADNSNVEISNPIYMKDYEDEDGGDEFALDPDKVRKPIMAYLMLKPLDSYGAF